MTFEEESGKYSLYECIQLTEANYHRARPRFAIAESANFPGFIAAAQAGKSPRVRGRMVFDLTCLVGAKNVTGIQRVAMEYARAFKAMADAGKIDLEFVAERGSIFEQQQLEVTGSPHEPLRFSSTGAPYQFQFGDQLFVVDMRIHKLETAITAIARARRAGAIITFQIHDLIAMVNTQWTDQKIAVPVLVRWSQILRFADRIVTVSRKVARDVACFVAETSMVGLTPTRRIPVAYCPLGCDPTGIDHTQPNDFDFPRDAQALVAVGTLIERKGLVQLVAAMQMLWDEGTEYCLLLSGGDFHGQRIRQQLSVHPLLNQKLFLSGYLSDASMFEAYRQCSALVYPSLDEGFGLPLVEAAAAGCPVIARDIEIFRETSGGKAFFFPDGGPEAIAAGLRKWFGLTRKQQLKFVPRESLVTWMQSAQMLKAIMFQGAACFSVEVGIKSTVNLVVPGRAGEA